MYQNVWDSSGAPLQPGMMSYLPKDHNLEFRQEDSQSLIPPSQAINWYASDENMARLNFGQLSECNTSHELIHCPTVNPKRPHSRNPLGNSHKYKMHAHQLQLSEQEDHTYHKALDLSKNAAVYPPEISPSLHSKGVIAIRALTNKFQRDSITRDTATFLFQRSLNCPKVQATPFVVTAMAAFMLACKTREKEVDVVPCVNMIHHLSANDITPANITEMEIHLLLLFDWTIHPCVPSEIYYPLLVKTLSVTDYTLLCSMYPNMDVVEALLQTVDFGVQLIMEAFMTPEESHMSMKSIAIISMVSARNSVQLPRNGWTDLLSEMAFDEQRHDRGPRAGFEYLVQEVTRSLARSKYNVLFSTFHMQSYQSNDDSGFLSIPNTPTAPRELVEPRVLLIPENDKTDDSNLNPWQGNMFPGQPGVAVSERKLSSSGCRGLTEGGTISRLFTRNDSSATSAPQIYMDAAWDSYQGSNMVPVQNNPTDRGHAAKYDCTSFLCTESNYGHYQQQMQEQYVPHNFSYDISQQHGLLQGQQQVIFDGLQQQHLPWGYHHASPSKRQ